MQVRDVVLLWVALELGRCCLEGSHSGHRSCRWEGCSLTVVSGWSCLIQIQVVQMRRIWSYWFWQVFNQLVCGVARVAGGAYAEVALFFLMSSVSPRSHAPQAVSWFISHAIIFGVCNNCSQLTMSKKKERRDWGKPWGNCLVPKTLSHFLSEHTLTHLSSSTPSPSPLPLFFAEGWPLHHLIPWPTQSNLLRPGVSRKSQTDSTGFQKTLSGKPWNADSSESILIREGSSFQG